MDTPDLFTTTDAAHEATNRLRAIGYRNFPTVKPRNLLNLEAHGSLGPWLRNSNGERQLTSKNIDELVRYFAGHYQAQGRYPIDNTPTTDPEDTAGLQTA